MEYITINSMILHMNFQALDVSIALLAPRIRQRCVPIGKVMYEGESKNWG